MSRRKDGTLELFAELPWWVSIGTGVGLYISLRFVVPAITFGDPILDGLAQLGPYMAWLSAIFVLPASTSAIESFRKRRLLDRQTGIESIRALSWKAFEDLLGEAFRRQGYSVWGNASTGPDGGIDLTIKQNCNTYLVQCKQWRARNVGVKLVREMLGLVTAHGAQGAIIVTSGMFTQEAKAFAAGRAIDLIEGHQLVKMIGAVQR